MAHPAQPGTEPLELLVVELGGQAYGLRTQSIREIRGWSPVTPMPNAPPEMLGIGNLRGTAIPIIDLSVKLGMGAVTVAERSAIVVVALGDMLVGLLVDGVTGMMTVPGDALQPMPSAAALYSRAAEGIIPAGETLICFLNLEELFADSLASVEQAAA